MFFRVCINQVTATYGNVGKLALVKHVIVSFCQGPRAKDGSLRCNLYNNVTCTVGYSDNVNI